MSRTAKPDVHVRSPVTSLVSVVYIETSRVVARGAQTSKPWRTPMRWCSTRTLLPMGLCVSLGAACVHRHDANPPTAVGSPVVTAEDIDRQPGQSIEQVLMDHFPGVTVTRAPDGARPLRSLCATPLRHPTYSLC